MKAIYMPRGAALEYGPYAVNLYQGCTHGCTYCYVPAVLHTTRPEFHAHCGPRPGILDVLEKDLRVFTGRALFLCFTCDPWQRGVDNGTTVRALQLCGDKAVRPIILTKNPLEMLNNALCRIACQYANAIVGTTISTLDATLAAKYEPNAPGPDERLRGLMYAKVLGLRTWVSMEPVLVPYEMHDLVDATWLLADRIKIGKWNHDKAAATLKWSDALADVGYCLDHYLYRRMDIGGPSFGWTIKKALLDAGKLTRNIPATRGVELWEE